MTLKGCTVATHYIDCKVKRMTVLMGICGLLETSGRCEGGRGSAQGENGEGGAEAWEPDVRDTPLYEVGDVVVSCPLQLQENVSSRAGVLRGIECDTGGADSLPVRPCEGLCARQEGRPNNSPPTVKSENKTTRRRYQEKGGKRM